MNKLNDAFYLLTNKLETWLKQLVLMLPNLLIAVFVLVVTFFGARLVRKASEKLLTKVSHSAALNNLIATLVYICAMLMGVFFALGILQLDKTVTSLLAGVGIIGLALGFAFQDIAANFISGLIIALRKPFSVGDVISSNDHFGTIERINLRTVDIRRQTGELVKVPNRKVFENALINYTHYGLRRIDIEIGVSYTEDLEKLVAVTLEAMQGITAQVDTKEVEVVFNEFGESNIRFLVRFWIHYSRQTDYVYARSEAIMKIKKAYDAHHIMLPFPVRTLDFGVKHHQNLSQKLSEVINPSAPVPPVIEPYPTPKTMEEPVKTDNLKNESAAE